MMAPDETPTDTRTDYLGLSDWRRQIASLYAAVRSRSASDPEAALQYWRSTRERLYREHPQSPVLQDERTAFQAKHFLYDPAMRFEAVPVVREESLSLETAESDITIPTSGGGAMHFTRIGWVDVPFPAGTRRLALAWMGGYAGGIFLAFRDTTNGKETYGAGRYLLDAAKSADLGGDTANDTLVLDFNFAYHPSCAFDPRWVCPLVPLENRIDLPVRAGERLA